MNRLMAEITFDGRATAAMHLLMHQSDVVAKRWVPRRSCAISSRNKFLHQHTRLRIKSQTVNDETGSDEWLVCDTGPGVHPLQIDLYWGEDEPRGAVGRQRARPRGTWMEYAFEVDVTALR